MGRVFVSVSVSVFVCVREGGCGCFNFMHVSKQFYMSGWSVPTFILHWIKTFLYFIESRSRDLLVGVRGLFEIYNECQIMQVLWALCGTFVRVYITSWLFYQAFKEDWGRSRVAWSLRVRKWLHEWLIHCRRSKHNYILWNLRWGAYFSPTE